MNDPFELELSPIMEELAISLLELTEAPLFSDKDLKNATIIFTEVLAQKMKERMNKRRITLTEQLRAASKLGREIRKMVEVSTGVDLRES